MQFPGDALPSEDGPLDKGSDSDQSDAAQSRPAQSRPAQSRPAQSRPAQSYPDSPPSLPSLDNIQGKDCPAFTAEQIAVLTLVQQRVGIDPQTLGQRLVLRAMQTGFHQSNCADWETYVRRLQYNKPLFESLVERLVIPETWFFREPGAFHALTDWARQLPRSPQPLRLLSIPCSTGEEPYSMAVALLRAGLEPQRFVIEGIDLSGPLLDKARQGRYGSRSLRQQGAQGMAGYLSPLDRPSSPANSHSPSLTQTPQYEVSPLLRQGVQFAQGNVVDPLFWADRPLYDVIFCRNLLIYFNEPIRQKAQKFLTNQLRSGGLIFLGGSEGYSWDQVQFTPLAWPRSFAYRKIPAPKTSRSLEQSVPTDRPLAPHSSHPNPPPAGASSSLPSPSSPPPPSPPPPSPVPDALSQARQSADLGNISEAIDLIQTYLLSHPTSVAGHCLLGILHQSLHQVPQALDCFRRALYLDPKDPDTLFHAALLEDGKGNSAQARLLRQRLERLEF